MEERVGRYGGDKGGEGGRRMEAGRCHHGGQKKKKKAGMESGLAVKKKIRKIRPESRRRDRGRKEKAERRGRESWLRGGKLYANMAVYLGD